MLSATEQFCSSLLPSENTIVSFGKWMFGVKKAMSNAELRLRVIRAEVNTANAVPLLQSVQHDDISTLL